MMTNRRNFLEGSLLLGGALLSPAQAKSGPVSVWMARAAEVSESLQRDYWNPQTKRYAMSLKDRQPDHIWGGGVMFSSLVAATRHDPTYRVIMGNYFEGLEGYWDTKVKIPGYEPSPTAGNGNDKYYDDNAWMVLTFLEAYELTKESRYLNKAAETLKFVMSGWDEVQGGGIWWHERHADDAKNTCVNGPAAVGCFRMAKFFPKDAAMHIANGRKILDWTQKMLRAPNGLYSDHIKASTGEIRTGQLSYNTGLMLRANLTCFATTGDAARLEEAKHLGMAAAGLMSHKREAYRDALKWSHLLVEADLELYRKTGEDYLMKRAVSNAEYRYQEWKQQPASDLLTNASLARLLWLMVDHETEAGKAFWKKCDVLKDG